MVMVWTISEVKGQCPSTCSLLLVFSVCSLCKGTTNCSPSSIQQLLSTFLEFLYHWFKGFKLESRLFHEISYILLYQSSLLSLWKMIKKNNSTRYSGLIINTRYCLYFSPWDICLCIRWVPWLQLCCRLVVTGGVCLRDAEGTGKSLDVLLVFLGEERYGIIAGPWESVPMKCWGDWYQMCYWLFRGGGLFQREC